MRKCQPKNVLLFVHAMSVAGSPVLNTKNYAKTCDDGRLSVTISQYLINAIFTKAWAVAAVIGDDTTLKQKHIHLMVMRT